MSDSNVLAFLNVLENLKTTKRTGWLNSGIANPESISDHMHRMSVMAMILDNDGLSLGERQRCVEMAIVHDLAEAIVGDITPQDESVSKEEKHRRECEAFESYVKFLGGTSQAVHMRELWTEYESGETKVAKFVKDLDKFEMVLQAFEYEKRCGQRLQCFFDSTEGKFQTESIKSLVRLIYQERTIFFKKS